MNYLKEIKLNSSLPENSYFSKIPAISFFEKTGFLELSSPVTFFTGENGSGKSTMLEAIAIAAGFNPEGGSRDHSFSTRNTHSELYKYITAVRTGYPDDGFFLRAESFYNIASFLDDNSLLTRYGGVSFHEQSHGESFLSLVKNRFEGNGIYILDEPESALSPQKLLEMMILINELVKQNSQFIIATHSPFLLAFPGAEIFVFSESGIKKTLYRDTEHYRLTRQFIEDPERMLHYLFL